MPDPLVRTIPSATEERILAASLRLFAEKGFTATTVGDIAAAARVNRAAMNYHFGGKDALYLLVLKRAYTLLCDDSLHRMTFKPGTPPEEKLRAFVRGMVRQMVETPDPAALQLLMREMAQPSTPACQEWVREYLRPKGEFLNGVLRELMPRGTSDERLWEAQFAIVGHCLFYRQNRSCVQMLMGERPAADLYADADRLAEFVIRFTLGGLTAVADMDRPNRKPTPARTRRRTR